MSSFGNDGNFINQFGVMPRSPLPTGLKRLHSDSAITASTSKSPRYEKTSGGWTEDAGKARERVLQLLSADVVKLNLAHRRNLSELFFLQNNGGYLDFETWLSSSSPQLAAYLQAHSFDISEAVGTRSTVSSRVLPVRSVPAITGDHGPVTSPRVRPKSPAHVGVVSSEEVVRTKPADISGQQSHSTGSALFSSGVGSAAPRSGLLVQAATNAPVATPAVLPLITITTPVAPPCSTGSSTVVSQTPVQVGNRQLPESRLSAKLTGSHVSLQGVQAPTHRGPGRPPGKRSAGNTVNGSRYRSSIPSGRIEHAAKQEAVILRRIAELRREGLWSADKLPKCADPMRSKTHWDYLLEEMKWLSTDFEQERKWKKTAARKLALVAVRQKREEEEKQKRLEMEREKELKRIAAFAAKEVRQFWNTVEKIVEYKSNSILEAKRKRALDKHLDFIVGQTERFSSLVQEGLTRPSTSRAPSTEVKPAQDEKGDSDFEQEDSSDDDESTLDKEEEEINKDDVDEEVALLQQECEMDLDDILDTLPTGYLEGQGGSDCAPSTSTSGSKMVSSDYDAALISKAPDEENDSVSSEESDHENVDEAASSVTQLPEDVDFSKLRSENSDVRQQELTHFAETAEKLQPKGYTLETTTVVTKVPFLLKHQLREYQHVGLDWLVTLYDRKLNGILADEMGLGKTIQTIAVIAHLACEKGSWGPHLIIVPTTVMLNWEMEFKKWCPAFKILTYYGSVKERKEKRQGWSKPNAFHVCITSYTLVLQDHLVFRRKKWEYLVLDEAQNIKNFKSHRWQMLLNFNAQRRLLLTGTPLQNSLMELWSLMHFLMPDIFSSHRDFKDWFSNPVTDMIEGARDFDEQTIKRLHKVLRPFILRRLKSEVEKQLPKKYERVVPCALSKRQRYLYDDFMSRASTKDQLSTGNVMSVLNVLMQLRKVCNHPNLFESRPITSPFVMARLTLNAPSLVARSAMENLASRRVPSFLLLPRCRRDAFVRSQQLAPSRRLIEELADDNRPTAPTPPCVDSFKFTPLKLPLPASLSRAGEAMMKKKNFQFVIPPSVAQDLDFNQPFLVQIQAPSGPKVVPIQLRPPTAEALAKIGIRAHPSNSASSVPTPPSTPVQLPVWRLSLPSQFGASTLEPPVSGSPSRLAVVNYGAAAGSGAKPGFSVSFLKHPPAQPRFGTEGVIRTRTVLFRPGIPRNAPTASTTADSGLRVLRPHITVQEVRPKTPPVVRYVDPTWSGLSSLPSSKPSTPTSSSSTVPASPNLLTSATSILPSPANTASSDTDVQEKSVDSSSRSVESSLDQSMPAIISRGVKRPLSSAGGLEPVAKRRSIEHRQQILQLLATENERRSLAAPLYGLELSEILSLDRIGASARNTSFEIPLNLDLLISRFCIFTPTVLSALPRSTLSSNELVSEIATRAPKIFAPFKAVIDAQMLQFPELRLIEYDCGKLQILSRLLRKLKDEGHRCLIFTQMAKMLDILEGFLSYMGLKYLRLDGATRIELRQVLMERFNQDARIFCMILSTRSGGLGVNLTGADTVIFYDSDWNPTMDAQAQDRCHRIGQTRDVHIYRLISEKTVEENILKKAQQKRRLGEVAIEEGSFTTEFFKKGSLKDIFELDVPVDAAAMTQQELEQQMASLEDEYDAQAARCAKAETMAELSEFDESQATGSSDYVDPDVVEVEQKMKQLMTELKPVERYAVRFLEALYEPDRLDELQQTEEEMEQRKLQWELANRDRLDQEKHQRKREEHEEFELTYSLDDSLAQMFCPIDPAENMPMWMPPTPPVSDTEFDPYVEPGLGYLYNLEPMEEGDLPPVAGELDLFRCPSKVEPAAPVQTGTAVVRPPSATAPDIPAAVAETVANIRNSFNKTAKDGQPQSLFDTGAAAYKLKRDVRRPLSPPSPSVADQETTEFPEWTILEDYALLTAVTKGQQMAYSLSSAHAGHVANWDYVAKWVSSVVGHYCSPRACYNRYQYVILPREEGRIVTIDAMNKKARKLSTGQQEIAAMKKYRLRTGQQFQQDGSSVMAAKVSQRFASIRQTMTKGQSSGKEKSLGLANCLPIGKINTKHELHLQSFRVNSDNLLNPGQLAEMREERLKELKKQHILQQQQQQQMALALQAQQQPVHVSFQSVQQQQTQHVMQHQLAQYGQAGAQAQGVMEMQHSLSARGAVPVPATYGTVSSTAGSLTQQQLQLTVQQHQSQLDGSQIAVSVHPASRLVASVHHVRHSAAGVTVASSSASPSIGVMMASSPRPNVVAGMAARSSLSAPSGVTTATIYRQMSAAGGLVRAQRTPPSTPAPSGLHAGTGVQVASAVHQRTITSSVSLGQVTFAGSTAESGSTSIIGPVVVQAPQTTVRFQTVSSAGNRQKIQFGGGGFLVSADVSKPTVLSVPPLQITGASASHQTVTPISIAGPGVTRGQMTHRQQMALAQSSLSAAAKKNIALPRIATFTHSTSRGSASPVHLVAPSVSSRLAASQSMHRQAASPAAGMRVQGTGAATSRNIPSISMIMPLSRIDTAPSPAGVSVTGSAPSTPAPQHTVAATTTAGSMMPSPQGTSTSAQQFTAPANRGQQ